MHRFVHAVTAAALAALLSTAPAAQAAEPVKIDVIFSLTGVASFLGNGESEAVRLVQQVVNKQGGIKGRPVQFDVVDDQSTPATAVQLMNAILARKPPAIIGTDFTATCNAIIPLSRTAGPVTYCTTPGVHPPAGAYAFSSNIGTEGLAPVMLRFMKEKGWTKFGFIASTDASGQDLEHAVDVALQRSEFKGVEMVAREHFNVTDMSTTAQMARIKASGAQAAILWTAGTAFGTLLRSTKDVGLEIPVFGGNANEVYAQLAQYKGFIPRELYFASPRSIAEGGVAKGPIHDAQSTYFAAYKSIGKKPDLPATMAWDPAMIVVDAYRKLGPDTTPEKVRDYITSLRSWTGINGVYNFSDGSQRGLGENACVVVRYDGDKQEFVNASRPAGRLK